jgi:acetyl-CoA C-acetyltransferase
MMSLVTPDPRSPVIVGVGQLASNRDRTVEGAREPLDLILEALQAAEKDAGAAGLLAAADAVHAVRVASWQYDDLAGQVGALVGAAPRTLVDTTLGGHYPVRLLDEAAARIWAGDSEVALVVGGEAQASVTMLRKQGVTPDWRKTPGGALALDLSDLGAPAMQAAGLLAPAIIYPLFENRLQAELGLTPAQSMAWSARLYADLSAVAATQPASWSPVARTAEDIGTVTPSNRVIYEPYPLSMNAMPHVDQAAAVIVTSFAKAQELGLTDVVHVWGGAGADDASDVLVRESLGRSSALELALDQCLAQAQVASSEVDLIDVYSCFPVVPKLAALHLGLPRNTVLSVTGGHSSFGGPLNSYSLHALVTMVERLRSGGLGLVHANGGYLTYQHAVLLSAVPHRQGYVGQPAPVSAAVTGPSVIAPADVTGDVVVETATVQHDREGRPCQAFVVARTSTGERVATSTPYGDLAAASPLSLASLPAGLTTHVGRRAALQVVAGGTLVTFLE